MIKQRLQTMILSMLVAMAAWGDVWDGSIATSFAGGTGTEDDPYQIATGAELAYLAQQVNGGTLYAGKYIKLTADIDLNGSDSQQWTPIGRYYYDYDARKVYENYFRGIFDGDGHTISNMYIHFASHGEGGLFYFLSNGAVVKNLGMKDVDIYGKFVGAICCINQCGTIENCYVSGKLQSVSDDYDSSVGGICGSLRGYSSDASYNKQAYIKNCYSACEIKVKAQDEYNFAGGILGSCESGSVANCYNVGSVLGPTAGGICGSVNYESTISNCYDASEVSGSVNVGCLFGTLAYDASIGKCYFDVNKGNGYGRYYGSGDLSDKIIGKTISELTAGTLFGNDAVWVETAGVYPRLVGSADSDMAKVCALAVFPANGEQTSFLQSDFTVSDAFDVSWQALHGKVSIDGTTVTLGSQSGSETLMATVGTASRSIGILIVKSLTQAGTESDPYQISTKDDLQLLSELVNGGQDFTGKYFKQTADIDLEGTESNQWVPIGDSNVPFKGVYDGNNHTVSGLYISNSDSYQALFGHIKESTTSISNLTVDGYVSADQLVALICAYNKSGTIRNCQSKGTVIANGLGMRSELHLYEGNAAGICGYQEGGSIVGCSNLSNVSATLQDGVTSYSVAGICGYMTNSGTIEFSSNNGVITSPYNEVAGIVGKIYNSTLSQLNNQGTVTGRGTVGGIVGFSSDSNLSQSVNSGKITGNNILIGGIAACFYYKEISCCYNIGEIEYAGTGTNPEIGGVCGRFQGYDRTYYGTTRNPAVMTNCYNAGKLTVDGAATYVGSLIGNPYFYDPGIGSSSPNMTVKNCYYDTSINGDIKAYGSTAHTGSDSNSNVTSTSVSGKTTAELKDGSIYFPSAPTGVWKYRTGQYPQLTIFAIEDGDVLTAEVDVENGAVSTATVEVEMVSTVEKTVAIHQLEDIVSDGIVDIPSTMSLAGETYTVTAINDNAFQGATNLEGVVIPSSVTEIGAQAFDGCTSLTSVTFEGNTMPTLGADAISTATVTSVSFPAAAYDSYDFSLSSAGFTSSVYQPTVTMKDNEWGTIFSTQGYSLPEGLEAYIVVGMDYENFKILVMQETGIQKDVPMLLHKMSADKRFGVTENSSFTIVNSGERSSIYKGASSPQTVVSDGTSQAYILYNNNFVRATNGTLPAYRCYLQLDPAQFSPSASPRFSIEVIDGEATNIGQINSVEGNDTMPWYTLGGHRLSGRPVAKGLYIHNGKKIFIK